MQGKVSPEQSTATQVYVGIDVCKAWLDVHFHPVGQQFRVRNSSAGFKELVRALGRHRVAGLVMEATGKYHRAVHRVLHEASVPVAIVNPRRARLFAEAKGIEAKTDRIDARVLALMAQDFKPDATPPSSQELEDLQELTRARQSAVDARTAASNLLGETRCAFLQHEIKRQLRLLEAHIDRLETEIARRIKADTRLDRRQKILTSIPGVGDVAATWLLTGLDELGTCPAKAAALLAGLAPIAHDSGQTKGPRHIQGGRGNVRRGIYMAAMSAITWNPTMKVFYDRLIANGKLHKVAITAVMRKLVVLANTLLTEDRHWTLDAPKSA
jgi:transposase